ncbi:hypothetical protein, partial [Cryobacterium sinapicolor]|uniref:hypothetical protein n=1 Tax=Cryobacterium sinapicolor TaxID=1259236 RepID=UPI001A7E1182
QRAPVVLSHTTTGAPAHDRWGSSARSGGAQTIEYSADRRRAKRENRYRWSLHFYELSSDFSAIVRQFMHEAGDQMERMDREGLARLKESQGRIREHTSRLALLAGGPVLDVAQKIRRHTHAVIQVCEIGVVRRAAEYPDGPYVALDHELDNFYQVVREQIGLKELARVRQSS